MSKEARKQRTMYMHTIEGKAATFIPDEGQIVYADILPYWALTPTPVRLRATVKQIKKDQAVTFANRKRWFKEEAVHGKYGYVKVVVRT